MIERNLLPAIALSLAACSGLPPATGSLESADTAAAAAPAPDPTAAAATKPPLPTDEMATPTGRIQTYSLKGSIDTTNPFFANLGSNGRTCASCHQAQDGWTITPTHAQAIFESTTPKGLDPLFRTNDGSVSPQADISTENARRTAYAMLLSKGLIRVGLPVPAGAEFALIAVDDPYGYASANELSLFRRPLPSTNLKFLSTVMWDGRETFASQTITFDLMDQSNGATLGHAQALVAIDAATQQSIVDFEQSLFTAATYDNDAGLLNAKQGLGDPVDLSATSFYLGINDVLGGDPTPGAPAFNQNVFTVFDKWKDSIAKTGGQDGARGAIARGQILFNTKPITISGVKGLNDKPGVPPSFVGNCSSCHDSPNAGDHSLPLPIDIGISDASRRTADLPLYTFRNLTTGETLQTTDPGRALVTGRWADMGKFKGPILRALSARAPYFHNGSAPSLDAVINFYDTRFAIGFTAAEKSDLAAFLRAL